ncbi:MAG TPA: DnaJ domain-containing protein [Vicinamibacteria bacterium]|jgi:molecular chaperone DnaJ
MDRPKDYYLILGVPRDATTAAIKRAYRRLVKKLHPDMGPVSASEDFLDVQAAYETLADAERRRRYDERLQEQENGVPPLRWSFSTSGRVELRRPVRQTSLSGEILLTPSEAAAGGVLPLDVPMGQACPSCRGTGGLSFDCARCGGEGEVQRRMPVPLHIPAGVSDGTVFQVSVDDTSVVSILLTVHIRYL